MDPSDLMQWRGNFPWRIKGIHWISRWPGADVSLQVQDREHRGRAIMGRKPVPLTATSVMNEWAIRGLLFEPRFDAIIKLSMDWGNQVYSIGDRVSLLTGLDKEESESSDFQE